MKGWIIVGVKVSFFLEMNRERMIGRRTRFGKYIGFVTRSNIVIFGCVRGWIEKLCKRLQQGAD